MTRLLGFLSMTTFHITEVLVNTNFVGYLTTIEIVTDFVAYMFV